MDELTLEELDNVKGGVKYDIGNESALEHEDLYRSKEIEKLKKEKERLLNLKENDELSAEELDEIKAGFKL